ncbi:MAG: ABC transporter ATP-binding protein [Nitrososphaerota archaeon]|nr:ABC transporter ATP-binding protein [Nitrososphaerota archaeon]
MDRALEVERVTKIFGKKKILNDVSFTVRKSSIHGLIGHNGAGKTTLFRIILGLLNPNEGSVRIFGTDLKANPSVKSKIGYVAEHPAFYSSLTVRENLTRFGNLKGIDNCKRIVEDFISRFDLSEYADMKFAKLSMGTKQRVAVARALMDNPELLILDEFLANIDPVWRHKLKEILKRLRKEGITILLSTHILADVEELCEEVTIIKMGKILYSGSFDDLYQKTKLNRIMVRISTNDNAKAHQILAESNIASDENGALLISPKNMEEVSEVIRILMKHGLDVYEVKELKPGLEEVYTRLHGG